MKKIISAITIAAMLAASSPALAGGRHDNRWGVDSNRHSPYYGQTYRGNRDYDRRHHRNRGVSTGEAVAIGIGALILGAAISNNQKNRQREQPQAYVESRPVWSTVQDCVDVRRFDPYGNVYYERYCK